MKIFLTNKLYFSILFFGILFLDIYVKLNLEAIPYRIITKPLIILVLLLFFIKNYRKSQLKSNYVIIGLLSFLLGDFFFIFYDFIPLYIVGMVFFVAGKLCYVKRFSNQRDFNMLSLVPFFVMCFAYMVFIMILVLDNLGSFFFPVLLYLFTCLISLLFAYLRKGDVDIKSFYIVLAGVFISVICDSITVIQSFYYEDFPYHKMILMLLYGISQYLIVMGLLNEEKKAEDVFIL